MDNTINCFVHVIANNDLAFFHWSYVFVEIPIFLPIGENFVLISGLVPIILKYSSLPGDFPMLVNIFGRVWWTVKCNFM